MAGNPPAFVLNISRQSYASIFSFGEDMRQENEEQIFSLSSIFRRIYESEVANLWSFRHLTTMNRKTQRQWAERIIRAMDDAFPHYSDVELWPQCQRYLPHALVCFDLIIQYDVRQLKAASLLYKVANYISEHTFSEQIEQMYQHALMIMEHHPKQNTTTNILFNLARLYYDQGKYEQAESFLQQAIAVDEQLLDPDDPNIALNLNFLAGLYQAQGKFEQAEPLFQRAQTIREKALGPEHPDVAQSLNNLAALYMNQGKFEQAEPLFQQALRIYEQTLGPQHPTTKIIQRNYKNFLNTMKNRKSSNNSGKT